MPILDIFSKKIKYLKADGRPQSLVRTGGAKQFVAQSGERTLAALRQYWTYYSLDGTIFAALNITAWNTIMVGFTLHSVNKEAKQFIQSFCDRINILKHLRQATLYTLIFGDGFIEKVSNKKNEPARLKVVDSRTMLINSDEYGDVLEYQQEINGQKMPPINVEDVMHFRFFEIPGIPYGLSIIAPNKDTIDRKVKTDEALFNAIQRHGTLKWVAKVGNEKDGQIPPESVMEDIKEELEDIESKNEFVIPWFIDLSTIDETGIEGVEEYFNYFQTQLVIGLLCPEEALGLGKGSTEACYDEKTETLTKDGWKRYTELTNSDEIATYNPTQDEIEYHKPIDDVKEHIYEHDGPMIHFKSQKMDMLVTPEHRMWINKNPTITKEKWEFVTAEDIYNSNSHWAIKSRCTREHPLYDTNEENIMKFIGYFISEGSINSKSPYCRISQKKEDSANRIRNVINNMDSKYHFHESYYEGNGYQWSAYDKGLCEWLKQFGDDCYNRHIPREFINKERPLLEALLFAAIDGDGTYDTRDGRNNCEYTTASKQLADDIQEIAIKCGYRAHITFSEDKRENRLGIWRVRIDLSNKDYIIITPNMCEKIYYKGTVHCLNVPNHIYITRRNDKVAIQGNTARVKAIMYERMIKAFQLEIANVIREELFNPILEKNGFEPNLVFIKFNDITEEDEALRYKWLGNLLRGIPPEMYPFTKEELRQLLNLPPSEIEEETVAEQPQEEQPQEEPQPTETPEEFPEQQEEVPEENEDNTQT